MFYISNKNMFVLKISTIKYGILNKLKIYTIIILYINKTYNNKLHNVYLYDLN